MKQALSVLAENKPKSKEEYNGEKQAGQRYSQSNVGDNPQSLIIMLQGTNTWMYEYVYMYHKYLCLPRNQFLVLIQLPGLHSNQRGQQSW